MLGWWRRWRARHAGAGVPVGDDAGEPDDGPEADAAPELTDELDLHNFLPRECADVVEEYLRAAHEAGRATVRIIHGKGKGTLRRTVHAVLERHPAVRSFALAGPQRGGWGATIVEMREPSATERRDQEDEQLADPGRDRDHRR